MSHIALHPACTARPARLSAIRDWLRQARVAINLPHQNVEDLSDHQLRDIGAGRKDIARAMDREIGRLGLLDIGWQQPRRRG
ncbi:MULTISPECIES: hypothetical protein [Mesorhizobium]|jgi:uncharacterized protein YjiS (DUF1127 family)|uniref:Uncharacterized protein n=1 Tax=Rhizobium loti TaxID=381 RepID=A0A6M7TUF4_RHILI|nr:MULTISPECIES: hypothetical protein [Mesorhizobium]KRB20863.1 hypothetical protein ASE05_19510 [Mesorhizobium sp. Root172]OBQ65565.1 hypothetical protein A8145_15505 [Mesorhizobium loti]QKC68691.1 hypothetical protein EB815_05815 [Mesorhizobium loti]QKC88004.1 hypothetical protein EB230_05790 [Mesorhizobium sp. NZP2234]